VYCPASFSVLPNKSAKAFFLQTTDFHPTKIAFPVIVVYIVVLLIKQQQGGQKGKCRLA
jgi:hypothetical protein